MKPSVISCVFLWREPGVSDEERNFMGLTKNTNDYRILRPGNSDKFLQKLFSREVQPDAVQQSDGDADQESAQFPLEVDQV